MKRFITISIAFLMTLSGLVTVVSAADEFPLREKYPEVKVLSTEDLAAKYDDTIIVDVRSTMEFDVAHVAKAAHVSISKATFASDLEKVRSKDGATPIAFYCNGHTCAKSYKAAKKAQDAGFANVYAFDAGIFDWIMAQPEKATLMGKTPAAQESIISKSDLKKRMLPYAEFEAKAKEDNSMVIDVRDPFQREMIPSLPLLRNIPMDRMTQLLGKKEFSNKQLLILDAVGKQVRWLQYHLEDNGYTNYYFLEGGVRSIK
jgi:rhodanese-related sulfurtransferase